MGIFHLLLLPNTPDRRAPSLIEREEIFDRCSRSMMLLDRRLSSIGFTLNNSNRTMVAATPVAAIGRWSWSSLWRHRHQQDDDRPYHDVRGKPIDDYAIKKETILIYTLLHALMAVFSLGTSTSSTATQTQPRIDHHQYQVGCRLWRRRHLRLADCRDWPGMAGRTQCRTDWTTSISRSLPPTYDQGTARKANDFRSDETTDNWRHLAPPSSQSRA